MTRLIDADAFKKILSEYEMKHDKRRSFDDYDCGAANAYEHAGDLLDEMPTVERPHGEWITKKDSLQTYCSHCDTAIPYSDEYDFSDFILCPYCGADMRDKKDDLVDIIEAAQSIKDRSEAE